MVRISSNSQEEAAAASTLTRQRSNRNSNNRIMIPRMQQPQESSDNEGSSSSHSSLYEELHDASPVLMRKESSNQSEEELDPTLSSSSCSSDNDEVDVVKEASLHPKVSELLATVALLNKNTSKETNKERLLRIASCVNELHDDWKTLKQANRKLQSELDEWKQKGDEDKRTIYNQAVQLERKDLQLQSVCFGMPVEPEEASSSLPPPPPPDNKKTAKKKKPRRKKPILPAPRQQRRKRKGPCQPPPLLEPVSGPIDTDTMQEVARDDASSSSGEDSVLPVAPSSNLQDPVVGNSSGIETPFGEVEEETNISAVTTVTPPSNNKSEASSVTVPAPVSLPMAQDEDSFSVVKQEDDNTLLVRIPLKSNRGDGKVAWPRQAAFLQVIRQRNQAQEQIRALEAKLNAAASAKNGGKKGGLRKGLQRSLHMLGTKKEGTVKKMGASAVGDKTTASSSSSEVKKASSSTEANKKTTEANKITEANKNAAEIKAKKPDVKKTKEGKNLHLEKKIAEVDKKLHIAKQLAEVNQQIEEAKKAHAEKQKREVTKPIEPQESVVKKSSLVPSVPVSPRIVQAARKMEMPKSSVSPAAKKPTVKKVVSGPQKAPVSTATTTGAVTASKPGEATTVRRRASLVHPRTRGSVVPEKAQQRKSMPFAPSSTTVVDISSPPRNHQSYSLQPTTVAPKRQEALFQRMEAALQRKEQEVRAVKPPQFDSKRVDI